MQRRLQTLLRDESGATAIEYGLILALLAVVVISAVTSLQQAITGKYNQIGGALK